MPVSTEWIRSEGFCGFFARPERATCPLPAVLVIQEIWGVETHIEDVARRLAAAGFAALAPDLFAEDGERPPVLSRERVGRTQDFMDHLPPSAWGNPAERDAALAQLPAAARREIEETRAAVFPTPEQLQRHVRTLRAAAHHLKHVRAETLGQPVACVGFCMG
ncbi:MAG TPA: dienelactone hydrolase family protein, partial [Holophaga sp.]|nr:dienelactone hydrolase family protein [Holophaga sp.]